MNEATASLTERNTGPLILKGQLLCTTKKGDKMYQPYALAEPIRKVSWHNLKYIGISRDILLRYSQHIGCNDKNQEEKNIWVRGILAQGKKPTLWRLGDEIEDVKAAREREQYLIRYALAQGAELFNKQITYTHEERFRAAQERAIYQAQCANLRERGFYVKGPTSYRSSTSAKERTQIVKNRPSSSVVAVLLQNASRYWYFDDLLYKNMAGEYCAFIESSDEEFDAFIRQYIPVIDHGASLWSFDDRISAIEFSWEKTGNPTLYYEVKTPKTSRK